MVGTVTTDRIGAKRRALADRARAFRRAQRRYIADEISYLVLVPTLRCNLSCSYCQVSRVAEHADGFDWSRETLDAVLGFIETLSTPYLKIEFQGGEPLLGLKHLVEVRETCRKRFERVEFVVCTNLQFVSTDAWAFLANDDVKISTSFDGTIETHRKQRKVNDAEMRAFLDNLDIARERFGTHKISALPTLDPSALPTPTDILDSFASWDLSSVFLRPVANYGFARKAHEASQISDDWYRFHKAVVQEMISRNYARGTRFDEFYLTHCLRRMLRSDTNGHVDLRNPNLFARDYLLIDHDGTFYPTDEARMLTRTGQIDLSIGHIASGLDMEKLSILNANASMDDDPHCLRCRHQSYCGRDVIDDLSRYGRIDVPRTETEFCKRHMHMFGLAEELIESNDPAVWHSLALWLDVPKWDTLLKKIVR
ncbi:MAG: His-Xaa-Ser system radical SAM maturase HxsB [Pseudomonadota bacterium]